ncbi:hypothetical protein [Microbispora bryophytorum]
MPRAGLDRATVIAAASLINGMRAEAAIGGPDPAPLHAGEGP